MKPGLRFTPYMTWTRPFIPPYSRWIAGPGVGQVALGVALERQDCLEQSCASAPKE